METGTYDPTSLICGMFPLVHKSVTILSGQGALTRGTVIGMIALGAATSAVKASGANTGNGTFVVDATTPVRAGAKPGVYTLRCITAVTNGGVFRLTDPDGYNLGDYTILAGAGGVITVDNDIKGVLTDAGTDFIVGDGFDVTIAAGTGKAVKSLSASVDGSNVPMGILADDVDATSADRTAPVYLSGEFNIGKMTFGAGHSAASVEAYFRSMHAPIYLKTLP